MKKMEQQEYWNQNLTDSPSNFPKPFKEKHWLWGEEWSIGFIPHELPALLENPELLKSTHWIPNPLPRGYYCDPWLVRHHDRNWLFFEFLDRTTGHGSIACGLLNTSDDQCSLEEVQIVLKAQHHISHPCVFMFDGKWYLLPEAADTGDIILFESTGFPHQWKPCQPLLPGVRGLDPVLFIDGENCWLFCSVESGKRGSDLIVFHSNHPKGPWRPHHSNPLKSGHEGIRAAGPIFRIEKTLFRPGQDSRFTYGQNTVLNEILILDENTFTEKPRATIDSRHLVKYEYGLHSICPGPGFCIIDGKRFTGIKRIFGPAHLAARKIRARARRRR